MFRSCAPWGGASLLVFLVAGCSLDSFTLVDVGGGANPTSAFVSGSAGATADSAQAILREMGLFVVMKHDGEFFRLTSKTASGKRFTLVMWGHKTDQGEKTEVRVEWDKDADATFWVQFLAALTAPPQPLPHWNEGPPK